MNGIETIVAHTLNIEPGRLEDETGYQTIAEWDSFAHVNLMLGLADKLGIEMTNELMVELSSVGAIKAFVAGLSNGRNQQSPGASQAAKPMPSVPVEIHRGLSGVTFDNSAITQIDAERGRLAYRGYDISDLADRATFEETAWLLIEGELPTEAEHRQFRAELANARAIPATVREIVSAMRTAHPMDVLRTAVSALSHFDTATAVEGSDGSEATKRAGIRLIAQMPALIAAHHALRQGREPLEPDCRLSHGHDFLRMLLGRDPPQEWSRLIEQDLIVHADHSSNASTFAARIAVGCGVDVHNAVTAAIATFAGPLHGGAVEQALHQIDRIGTPENAAGYVRDRFARNEPIMGFGHRVYRGEDPRARHFRTTAAALSRVSNDTLAFEIVEALVEAMQPMARLGIGPNVDLYAGLVYRLLGLPDDLAVAIFAAGRMPGWIAQILEQRAGNILIRPLLNYIGPPSRAYRPMSQRGPTTADRLAS